MKKWFLTMTAILILAACSNEKTQQQNKIDPADEVTIYYGGIENAERLMTFTKRVGQHKRDEMRITQLTKEGDPIYQDVRFDGKKYQYTHDNREDTYGNKEVTKDTCKGYKLIETNTHSTAILEKCKSDRTIELFDLKYDSSKEDRFDFALKYGENLEKEIDTNKTPLKNKEKNIVYKNLVYIDYLQGKSIEESCADSKMKYELTVWINGGKKHYKWNQCDSGEDAKDLTGVADTIMKVFEYR
jgi:hypothetical protein